MIPTLKYAGIALAGALIGTAAMSACSADSAGGGSGGSAAAGVDGSAGSGGAAATGAVGGSGGSGNSGGAINLDAGDGSTSIDPDAACSKFQTEATLEVKPVDIVFILDNSCSMNVETAQIEQNINVNFANVIQAAGIDYRVIMLSEYGPSTTTLSGYYGICVGPPLGASNCPVQFLEPTVQNPPTYFHFRKAGSTPTAGFGIYSTDGWCKMLDWYDKPDAYNQAPGGWGQWLRTEALKSIVMISDDDVSCTAGNWSYNDSSGELQEAQKFDADLLARAPSQFGTASKRNYVWYSIVGVQKNPTNPTGIYEPTEPITSSKCSTAVNASPGNQALSQITGGLRFPVCEGAGFDAVFQAIAKGVIESAKVACEFDVPEAPEGKTIDLDTLSVDYSPGGNDAQKQNFTQVKDQSACKPGAFFIDQGKILLCPDTCNVVQQDDKAKLAILVDCLKDIPR